MSPLVWDLAHVANQEELWLLRAVGGRDPMHPQIDPLYDAFEHPRAQRPTLPLLTPAEARRYGHEVRGRVLDLIEKVKLPPGGFGGELAGPGPGSRSGWSHSTRCSTTRRCSPPTSCGPARRCCPLPRRRPRPPTRRRCPPRYTCPAGRSPWARPPSRGPWTTSGRRTPWTSPASGWTPPRSRTRPTRIHRRWRLRRPPAVDGRRLGAPAARRAHRPAVLGLGGCVGAALVRD